MRTVYLDTETTGLNPGRDELLEVGILADDGSVLLDALVRPTRHTNWPKAQGIHGIAPADVAGAPPFGALRPRIFDAVSGARVVIYNAPFDAAFLGDALDGAAEVRCAMHAFAEAFGEWSDWHGHWRWQTLETAAAHVRFAWPGAAHRAIHDCAATRAVWRYLTDPAERPRIEAANRDDADREEIALAVLALEQDNAHERQTFEVNASRTLFERMGLRVPARLTDADRDAISRTFTGYTRTVWETWHRYPGLPIYRRRTEIPAHLVARSGLKRHPARVLAALPPAALYMSRAGSRVFLLYDPHEADRLADDHSASYASFATAPGVLATGTRVKEPHAIDPEPTDPAPAAEVRRRPRRGQGDTPIYRLDGEA